MIMSFEDVFMKDVDDQVDGLNEEDLGEIMFPLRILLLDGCKESIPQWKSLIDRIDDKSDEPLKQLASAPLLNSTRF